MKKLILIIMLILCAQMVVGAFLLDELENDVKNANKYKDKIDSSKTQSITDTKTDSKTDTKKDDSKTEEKKDDKEKVDKSIDWEQRRRQRYYANRLKNDKVSGLDVADNLVNYVTQGYEEFNGFDRLGNLYFGEEELRERKEKYKKEFCEEVALLGGVECWTGYACDKWFDVKPGPSNVVMTQDIPGFAFPAASLQAQRSEPITFKDEGVETTIYEYKVTFSLENFGGNYKMSMFDSVLPKSQKSKAKDGNMIYNLIWQKSQDGSSQKIKWYKDNYRGNMNIIEEGKTASAQGGNMIIRRSENYYDEVCLWFTPSIKMYDGGEIEHICTQFVLVEPGLPESFETSESGEVEDSESDTGSSTGGEGI